MHVRIVDKTVLELVRKNGGYCPCAVVKDIDTFCMGKEFREAPIGTVCGCGLYRKEEDSE